MTTYRFGPAHEPQVGDRVSVVGGHPDCSTFGTVLRIRTSGGVVLVRFDFGGDHWAPLQSLEFVAHPIEAAS